jgi:hypothetical protein
VEFVMSGNQGGLIWQAQLVGRHLQLFNREFHGLVVAPGFPSVGDGWQELVRRAVERIAAAVSAAPDSLLLTQIKEKFGTLRLSTWPGLGFTDAMDAAVEEAIKLAEARSACTCEQWGAPGWSYTHAKGASK